ncbi:MAG: hypothetical protein AAF391_13865 [Bacteroidota bacterium]
MKKSIIILLFFIQVSGFSQSYTVIHSIGKIYDVKNDRHLSKGMKIDESAELRFDSPNARAAVLSSSRGRYIIQANSSSNTQSDLAYTLSSIITPARGKLSTRAGGINNALDFKKHFEEGPVAVLGGIYKVKIVPSAYPMNDNQFFYLQYQYKSESINKKLSNEGEMLIFNKEIYSIDDNPIEAGQVSEMKLFYYNATSQESQLITELSLSPVSDQELNSIATNFTASERKSEAICEWINDLYGKCSVGQVEKALTAQAKK